ncbi:MAG: tetratricopeptide repeat protein [Gammaproteobacteria bacterium]|nr:tetratricopeptide repeat protein [Gammaproteobacteria bacterium]
MNEQQAYIFEVSENNFGSTVVLNSHKIPVIVEFMGVWSEPCIRLEDSLVALAREFAGQFIFAKVDIDEQKALREEYGIQNLPTLKVFKDGEVVRTEEGLLNDDELGALLKSYGIYRESDEMREQARQQHMAGDTMSAINLLTEAIKKDPRNTRVAMDMVQVMLDIGELESAQSLFDRLPANDKHSTTGRSLSGQLTFRTLAGKTAGRERLLTRVTENPEDHDARFDLAVCLVTEHDYAQAMEQLFSILDMAPDYKEGAAKEMIINLSNMLAPNDPELAQEFRRRLSNALS